MAYRALDLWDGASPGSREALSRLSADGLAGCASP